MAQVVQLPSVCQSRTCAPPVSLGASLVARLRALLPTRRSAGSADDLPERLRRDLGLPSRMPEPGALYHNYLAGTRP
jgi:hypothetical protein